MDAFHCGLLGVRWQTTGSSVYTVLQPLEEMLKRQVRAVLINMFTLYMYIYIPTTTMFETIRRRKWHPVSASGGLWGYVCQDDDLWADKWVAGIRPVVYSCSQHLVNIHAHSYYKWGWMEECTESRLIRDSWPALCWKPPPKIKWTSTYRVLLQLDIDVARVLP